MVPKQILLTLISVLGIEVYFMLVDYFLEKQIYKGKGITKAKVNFNLSKNTEAQHKVGLLSLIN
jgi:hypothetical protein